MKDSLKNKMYAGMAGLTVAALPILAHADEGGGGGGLASVETAITKAAADVTTSGGKVIASAVGVGIIFWGAKLVWGKFKSMAK